MKIQTRLLLSILPVVFVSILTVTGISISHSTKTIEKQVKDNAGLLSKSYSAQLDAKVNYLKRMSEDLAAAIVTAVNVETVLINARKRYPEINRVLYTSLDGRIKDMSPYSAYLLEGNHSLDKEWIIASEEKKTVLSDPLIYFDENTFLIYSPVIIDYIKSKAPEVVGVVILAIPTSYMFEGLSDVIYGETGSIFVINKDGYFVSNRDESKIMTDKFSDMGQSGELEEIERSMKKQATGLGIYYIDSHKYFVSFAPIKSADWALFIAGEYSEFTSKFKSLVTVNTLILIISLLFASVVISFIVHGVVLPLSKLTDVAEKLSQGDFSIRSSLTTNNEVGLLSRSFDKMVDRLEDYNSSLEKDVLVKTDELTVYNEELQQTIEELDRSNQQLGMTRDALWSEMELAKKLQTVLLPDDPKIDGLDISAFMKTASSVGGDYYDVINVDGKSWFLIGDVSGHGVTAGLIMMMVQTSIHVALSQNPNTLPSDLLTVINKTIHYNITKLGGNRYMTLTVFACLEDHRISFAGAHLPVIIYRKETNSIEMIETSGTWIGLVGSVHNMNSNSDFLLADGDIILLYTDGISEAVTEDGKYFSQQGLVDIFKTCTHLSSEEICNIIKDYSEKLTVDDDVTAMVLKKVSK